MYWDPLYIVAYWVGVLLLTKHLKPVYPDVTQTWYAENSWALSMFDNLERYFTSLKHNSLDWGYYPETNKMILIVHQKKSKRGYCLMLIMGLRCAWAPFVLAVISGMTNPKAIVSKSGRRNGSEIFVRSLKHRENMLRKVTLWWPVQSNLSGYLCNAR